VVVVVVVDCLPFFKQLLVLAEPWFSPCHFLQRPLSQKAGEEGTSTAPMKRQGETQRESRNEPT